MLPYQPWDKPIEVALLAEGVDRNNLMQGLMDGLPTSPSSRRAWIEISGRKRCKSVKIWSPSSRRAWIEIRSK